MNNVQENSLKTYIFSNNQTYPLINSLYEGIKKLFFCYYDLFVGKLWIIHKFFDIYNFVFDFYLKIKYNKLKRKLPYIKIFEK